MMRNRLILTQANAQTAIEYMLILAVVVAIVLIGLKTYLPRTQVAANAYLNRTVIEILGEPPRCGDGICAPIFENAIKCCIDCGVC